MGSLGAATSAPTSKATTSLHNYLLLLGGYFSLAFAALQVTGIWWSERAIRYLGGPAELSVQQPLVYILLCVAVALIVAVFGFYGLSGAGKSADCRYYARSSSSWR